MPPKPMSTRLENSVPSKTFQIPVSKLGAILNLQSQAQPQFLCAPKAVVELASPRNDSSPNHSEMEMEVHRGVQPVQSANHHYHQHLCNYGNYIKTEPSEGSSSASENSGSPNKIHHSISSPAHEGHTNFSPTPTSNTNSIGYLEDSSKAMLNKNLGIGKGNAGGRLAANRALTADRKRPYPCLQCPSRFGSKMELEEHQNSHTGMKPFECDICKSRFNRRSTLWNHKRIHSEAKPFVCTVCQMQFKWKNSLKCHKEMHMRKNEATDSTDNDIKQLTYATAAKRKLAESIDSIGTSSTTSSTVSSHGPLISSTNRKRAKLNTTPSQNGTHVIVQTSTTRTTNPRSSSGINVSSNSSLTTSSSQTQLGGHAHNHSQNQHGFHTSMGHNLHASDLLGHNPHPSHSQQLELDTNLDFMNNLNLNANLMQAICSGDMEQHLGQFDFGRSQNHASSLLFSQADDQSKMLSSHFLGDIKADDLHTNSLTAQMNSTAPSLNMRFPLLNSVIGMELQHFNSLTTNDRNQHHLNAQQLNTSIGMDYVTDSMLNNVQTQNSINASQLHIPPSMALNTAHVTSDMLYQQPLDPALLLNTASHGATDYLSNIDYMVSHNVYGSHALVHNDLALPSAVDNIPSPIPVHPQPQHHGYSIGQPMAVPTPTSNVGNNTNSNRSQLDFQQDLKNVIQKVLPCDQW